jgi:hypothetical protein
VRCPANNPKDRYAAALLGDVDQAQTASAAAAA